MARYGPRHQGKSINLYGNGLIGYIDKTTNKRYYYVKDHLGSIRQVIHKTADYGNDGVVAAKNYQPYGSIIAEYNNATDDRYDFTEKQLDAETYLHYFGARYYDSGIGRWTTADPLGDKYYGWSPYAYTLCNPLKYFDPDGRAIWRAGEGYINGYRAREIVIQQMRNALRGENAVIDFVRQNNSFRDQWEDIKDFFNGNTYSQGGMVSNMALRFGANVSLSGAGSFSEFFVDTRFSFKQLNESNPDIKLQGQNANGENILTLSFQTKDYTKNDVIRYTTTEAEINKLLEGTGKTLKSYTITNKYKKNDKEWEEEKTIYYIE